MTVYSLPLALHWLGAAFVSDYTNMEQMEKEIPKKRPDKVHVPLGWQVFSLHLPFGESGRHTNPQMAGQALKTENC